MYGYTPPTKRGVSEGGLQHVTSTVSTVRYAVLAEACAPSRASIIVACDGQSTASTAAVYCVCTHY